jgi:hypothetical protein
VVLVAGGGWGIRSGAIAGNIIQVFWVLLLILLIVLVLRALGVL